MRFLSSGESHGPGLTAIIEGLPAGLPLDPEAIDAQLRRRQGGYGRGGRMAIERDRVEFLAGLRHGLTLGTPLALRIANRDWANWRRVMDPLGADPGEKVLTRPRPGHADLAGGVKYGFTDLRNVLERSSARETALRVAVGAVVRTLLGHFGITVCSFVLSIGEVAVSWDGETIPAAEPVEASPVRCHDAAASTAMQRAIDAAREAGDTLGGAFGVAACGLPAGLGSYVHWDRRLDGRLAAALMSLPGIKAVEIGAGFGAAARPGSQVHDPILRRPGEGVVRPTNRAGGLEGGVTNGMPLLVRAAMKPIPTLGRPLPSVDLATGEESCGAVERSDVCAVPAAAVAAEAVLAWELAVALRDKFAGDTLEEMEAAFRFYRRRLQRYLWRGQEEVPEQ